MTVSFDLSAQPREDVGKGASRRLRRSGLVPAVVYGGGEPPESITVPHKDIDRSLQYEAFYSHILTLTLAGKGVQAILKDVQRHPYKREILHLDFQRVKEDEEIKVNVPLHFTGEDVCIGVKQGGGTVSHVVTEVEVECLPRYLPEYLDVDVSALDVGDAVHLSDIKVPEGVRIVELAYGEEHDYAIANVQIMRAAEEAEEEAAEEAAGLEAPEVGAPPEEGEDQDEGGDEEQS